MGKLLATVTTTKEVKKSQKKQKTNTLHTIIFGSLTPTILIMLWELLCRQGVFPTYQLPAPSVILKTIITLFQDGSLWTHIGITTLRVFIAFILGSALAVILGSFVGLYKKAEQLFDPMIQAFRSIPSLAWVPLFILWMGIGETSKITMIAVGVFFPVYLNTVSGITGVDRKLIEVGKMYGLSSFQLIWRVILPAALPLFLVGLRSGLGLGWMFVVAAELMGASKGLGYLLVLGQNTLSPELIIASILLFAIIGKLSDWMLKLVEKRTLTWQDGFVQQ
ncbi:ABC transporter permease [Caldibacillus thermolactis]|jgi:sulfonate transport system permease protein|uniref:ABC transporter permease n=1 Tax=Pallidibacillus thermolactis TaxID=251051 RepID=A0ABT2WD02_9BACI|nr:ABC transporter permease [Pallidibacillus thermolactis]MCU9593390.1 ABC transporter permease [Pallidibacillus thermolactis]MED1673743.1 ABC transporter permease [Pallidibacillus thermolactis subsp. kokeshiiformis]